MTEQVKVPEIRFAGFTDPWEQRKFSELASLRRGLTYSPADIRPYGQGIRVLRSSNIDEDEFTLSNEDVFVDETVVGIELVQEGEILITAANGSPRLVGKRAIINGLTGKTVHGGFMLCAHAEQPDYVAALMGSRWYQHFLATGVAGGNGSIGNLDKAALEDEFAFVPSIEEQELIGVLFSRLDDLITLHQRKYDKLVVFKKSMLEKMFPKDGESVPEIRFAGFTDPWEQRKLGEFSKKNTIKNANGALSETFTNSAEQGVISQLDYFDHDITNDANISGYYVVQPDDFVYNPRISATAPCGPINRNRLNRAGVMSPLYTVFSVDASMDKTYLEHYFKTSRWHDFMFLEGNTGARSDRFSISDATFFEMPIWCPEISEQMAIAKQLETTDTLITLHQRKLELLQNIKKSLLDKMFV